MYIETERLVITHFTPEMARDVFLNSQEPAMETFLPDEVFPSVAAAAQAVSFLMEQYEGETGPFVYPVLLKTGENVGYVQLCAIPEGWEVGYHIAAPYTGRGYAAEAVKAFLPAVAAKRGLSEIWGVSRLDNAASVRVLERCGFALTVSELPYQGVVRPVAKGRWTP